MAKVLVSGLVWVSVLSGNAVVWFWAAVITSLASNLKKGLVAFSSAMVEGAVGLFSAVNFCAFFRRSVIDCRFADNADCRKKRKTAFAVKLVWLVCVAVLFGSTARANLKLFSVYSVLRYYRAVLFRAKSFAFAPRAAEQSSATAAK